MSVNFRLNRLWTASAPAGFKIMSELHTSIQTKTIHFRNIFSILSPAYTLYPCRQIPGEGPYKFVFKNRVLYIFSSHTIFNIYIPAGKSAVEMTSLFSR